MICNNCAENVSRILEANSNLDWMPIESGLPKYPFEVLVTVQRLTKDVYVTTAVFNEFWKRRGRKLENSVKVIAWKELPQAYKTR